MLKTLIAVLVIAAAVAAGAYYVMIPSSWPPPTITAEVPKTARLGNDITVTITVHSRHPNIGHHEVVFFPAGYMSSSVETGTLIYPIYLEKGTPKEYWDSGEVSLKTRDTRTVFTYDVPLGEVFYKGNLGPGTLRGRIDFGVDYPVIPPSGSIFSDRYPSASETLSAPFTIELTE